MAALETPASYFSEVLAEYQARRDLLVQGLSSIGIHVTVPKGAFYIAVPLPVEDAEDFATWLARDFDLDGETVCMAPLAGFYSTPGLGRNEVRLAYVLDQQRLARCVKIIAAGLERYMNPE